MKMRIMGPSLTAAGLAALVALAGAGAAWADPGNDDGAKKVEKRRVVVVSKDGKEQVYDSDAPLVRRGYLGIGLADLSPELRTHFGAPEEAGVMVAHVEAGSPAEKAGLKVGDILTALDGKPLKSSWDLSARVRELEDGKPASLEVWRDRKVRTLTATIEQRERPEIDMGPLLMRHGDGEPMILHLPGKMAGPDGEGLPGLHMRQMVRAPRTPREIELEKKLQDLEKRLAELEKQLKNRG